MERIHRLSGPFECLTCTADVDRLRRRREGSNSSHADSDPQIEGLEATTHVENQGGNASRSSDDVLKLVPGGYGVIVRYPTRLAVRRRRGDQEFIAARTEAIHASGANHIG